MDATIGSPPSVVIASPPSVLIASPPKSNIWKWVLIGLAVAVIVVLIIVGIYFAVTKSKTESTTPPKKSEYVSDTNTNISPATPVAAVNLQGVRFIRILRVRVNPMNDNIIHVSSIFVKSAGLLIPLVGGTVTPQYLQYGWEKINTGDNRNFAHTKNQPGCYITVDIGGPKAVDEIVIGNRWTPDQPNLIIRIIGCELQALDANSNVIQKWDFASTNTATANTAGSKYYKVGVSTSLKLEASDNP